jgi:hypothetical protein
MSETPKYSKDNGWTCPPGYAWPKCYECGHTFYVGPPQPMVNGKAADGGLCHWCQEERPQ